MQGKYLKRRAYPKLSDRQGRVDIIKLIHRLSSHANFRTATTNSFNWQNSTSALKVFIVYLNCVMSKPVALITGGASGIGLALTKHLLAQGWKVVIADINEEVGKALQRELGSNSSFVRADVRIYSEQTAMFKHAFTWGGNRLDFFAANAGVDDKQDMHTSVQDLDENGDPKPLDLTTIDVDLTSVIQGCWIYKHYARKNAKRGGKIVITSSIAGF